MIARIIKSDSFKRSEWTGGTTTEFYISPEGADFKKREFDFRISSASFTSTESSFSDFTGFKRFILPLKGTLKLKHEGEHEASLEPYRVDVFNGSWSTYSWNSLDCIDFNFIASEKYKSNLQVIESAGGYNPINGSTMCVYSESDYSVKIISDESELNELEVCVGNLLVIEEAADETLSFKTKGKPIIVCEFSKNI